MNPVIEARRTAAGLISQAASGSKSEYDLMFRMYLETMASVNYDNERSLYLLAQASIGIAAFMSHQAPEYLEEAMLAMAGQ